MQLSPSLVAAPVIAFVLYRRVRRQIGRQLLRPTSMIVRVVILSLVATSLLVMAPLSPMVTTAEFGGLAAGLAIAWFALRRTTFETTAEGRYYTPNPWVGAAVSALLVARVAMRLAAPSAAATPSDPFAALASSPLTLATFFLIAGYYGGYTVGLLRRSPASEQASARSETTPG